MKTRFLLRPRFVVAGLLFVFSQAILSEGSRSLYPATYPAAGSRANLDLQVSQRYMDRVLRRGFMYVYAQAGEYIVLGSSNRTTGLGIPNRASQLKARLQEQCSQDYRL